MVTTKHCLYPGCRNDTRHNYKDHMKGVFFIRFPKPKTNYGKCVLWLKLCGRSDPNNVKSTWYVCSKHFVGHNGPTKDHPNPLPYSTINEDVFKFAQDLGWSYRLTKDLTTFSKIEDLKVSFHVEINSHGDVIIAVLGKKIKDNHYIWENVPKIAKGTIEIKSLLEKISQFSICIGNPEKVFLEKFKHATSKTAYLCTSGPIECIRSISCSMVQRLGSRSKRCHTCCSYRKYLRHVEYESKELNSKIKKNTVMKITARKRRNFLKLRATDTESFLKIFKEQMKINSNAKGKTGFYWHPDIIEYCCTLRTESPLAYQMLRKSGFFKTLSNFALAVNTTKYHEPGFINERFLELERVFNEKAQQDHQRYVCLAWDEVRVTSTEEYGTVNGEPVGFVPPNGFNFSTKRSTNIVASHIFRILVRSISSNINFPLAIFPSTTMPVQKVHELVWEAVEKLETMNIKVLGLICDATVRSRIFFQLSAYCSNNEIPNSVENLYARDEERSIYFISDVPHLIKSVRNCWLHSSFQNKTKNLWKNGKKIMWQHLINLYTNDSKKKWRLAPKLTFSHIFLNPYSQMRTKLACQVLSQTVANALENEQKHELSETIAFVNIFNKYFDLMNSKHACDTINIGNPDIVAYTSPDDERLKWLQNDFLKFLDNWEDDVEKRVHPEGKMYTESEKKQMLLCEETRMGLRRSVYSIGAIIKFMLNKKAPFVLTSHLNQDTLEQEFSRQMATKCLNSDTNALEYIHNSKRLSYVRPIIRKYLKVPRRKLKTGEIKGNNNAKNNL